MSKVVIAMAMIMCVGLNAVGGWENVDLTGTRPGPTGYYMALKDRAAYIKETKNDPAKWKAFQETILKSADEAVAALKNDAAAEGDIVACARAFLVTEKPAYFAAVRKLAATDIKEHFELWGDAQERQKRGMKGDSLVTWGRDTRVAKAYDLVADKLPPEEEKAIRARIKNTADGVMEWICYVPTSFIDARQGKYSGTTSNKNISARTLGIWSEVGYAIHYEKFINWALDMKPTKGAPRCAPGGFKQWISNSIDDGALWGESPAYGRYFIDGVIPMARYAYNYDGTDLFALESEDGATIQGMIDGIIGIAWPASSGPYVNQGHQVTDAEGRVVITHADYGESPRYGYDILTGGWATGTRMTYETTKKQKYKWFVEVMDGKTGTNPPPAPSKVFRKHGMIMLRADETPSYWLGKGLAIMVRAGEQVRSAPGDTLSMTLHANGRLFLPQWSPWTYENAKTVGWNRRHLRFNTINIDGREGWYFNTMHRSDFQPEVKFISLRGSRHGNDSLERIFMVTREYALDLFDVAIGEEASPLTSFQGRPYGYYGVWSGAPISADKEKHTIDWVIHGLGFQSVDHPELFEPSEELARSGYPNRWLEQERRRRSGKSFHVDWRQENDGVRMHMIGAPQSTIYLADSPRSRDDVVTDRDANPFSRIPTVVVRRSGDHARFAALYEPFQDNPEITDFTYLHRPEPKEQNPSVAVRISAPDYTDRLYATLGLQGDQRMPQPSLKDKLLADKVVSEDITTDWLFKTDPQDVGNKEKWFAAKHSRNDWMKVDVGVDWKTYVPGYHGTAWYTRSFWAPKVEDLYVLFEGIDEDAWVYLNGKFVGERVCPGGFTKWDKPFVMNLREALRPGEKNTLVVRVWKNIFQTGIYRPVKLLLDSPGTNAAPAVKHRTAQQPPLVTIVSDDDPCEIVKFRGQAYVRYADGRIIARGDLTGFCIAAPGLPAQGAVTVNGIPAKYETVGDYVVVGDAGKPEGNAKALSVIAEKDAPGSPVELEFPQQLVNIDAEQGGYMVVRVTNIVSPQVSGRIEVAPAPGLAVSGGSQRIEGVKAGHRSERVFQLKAAGCKPGTLQPVRVRLYVGNAGQERLAWETWRKVAVGVVVEQVDYAWIQEQFTYPGYKLPGVFKGQQGFVFDVVRVRAPGYTIDIDKWSGAARWILQPDGTLGWKTATYPYRWLRDEDPRLREQTDFGPGDWFKRAVFEGLSTDQETGQTVAAFRSEDGARTWSYSFAPGRVQSSENGKAGDDAGFGMPTAPAPIDNEPIIPPQIQTTEK